jgi:hypothetical protein
MVVAVLVVDSQETEVSLIKLPTAFGANRAMDFQRLRPVVGVAVGSAAHLFDKGRRLFGSGKYDLSGAARVHGDIPFSIRIIFIVESSTAGDKQIPGSIYQRAQRLDTTTIKQRRTT